MIIPEGFTQINLKFTGSGLPTGAEVTFAVINPADQPPTTIAADVLAEWAAAGIMGNLSNGVSVTSVLAKNGPNETGPSAEIPASVPGTGGSGIATPNVTWLVKKATPLGGRRGSGRMYLPGVIEGAVDGAGQMDPGNVTALQGDLDTFLTGLVTAGNPMYLLHAESDEDDPDPSPVPDPTIVSDLLVSSTAATQRRRLRR